MLLNLYLLSVLSKVQVLHEILPLRAVSRRPVSRPPPESVPALLRVPVIFLLSEILTHLEVLALLRAVSLALPHLVLSSLGHLAPQLGVVHAPHAAPGVHLVALDGQPRHVGGAEAVVHHVPGLGVLARLTSHGGAKQRRQLRPDLVIKL